jgi:DNA-binding transcriptional LysR family regulator
VLDPVFLRSFVALADSGSFTRAAVALSLSQPTISQHVRKLEAACGRTLVDRDTRAVRLTDDGDALLGFARTILAAHDQAVGYFRGSAMRGRLRFGAADDLALTQLPQVLRDFRQSNPQITLELTVGQSGALVRRLEADQLDLVYVKHESGEPAGRRVRRDRMVWVAHRGFVMPPGGPMPLIAYPNPSLSRTRAIDALERSGRTWRVTCTVREVNGALAAVRAGLGIAVFPLSLIPGDLAALPAALDLPELGEVDFTLLARSGAPSDPTAALSAAIVERSG